MQQDYVNLRDNYLTMQFRLCCLSIVITFMLHVDKNKLHVNIEILHVVAKVYDHTILCYIFI